MGNILTGFARCFGHTAWVLVWLNNAQVSDQEFGNRIHPDIASGAERITCTTYRQSRPSGPHYTGIDPTARLQIENLTFDDPGNRTNARIQSPPLIRIQTHNSANQIWTITDPATVIQPPANR